MKSKAKTVSIVDLLQKGPPPVGQRVLLYERRSTSGADYWTEGVCSQGRIPRGGKTPYIHVNGIRVGPNMQWIPLPPSQLTPQGMLWEAEAVARRTKFSRNKPPLESPLEQVSDQVLARIHLQ